MTIVVNIDLRASLCPVRHQGARNTCLAFVLSELNRFHRNGVMPLSPEYLYASAAYITPHWRPHDGTLLPHGLTAVASPGQPSEIQCPYTLNEPLLPLSPPAAFSPMHSNRFQLCSAAPAAIANYLAKGQPLGLGIWVTPEFSACDQEVVPFTTAILPGEAHAVMIVGAGVDSVSQEQHFLVRNSWGANWGIAGHAWVSAAYIDVHGLAAFGA